MADKKYEQTHPLYEEMLPVYEQNAALYDGGRSVDGPETAPRYLHRHDLEREPQYEIRCKRAAYRNYAAPTVDLFASSISDGAERTGLEDIPILEEMLTNCDRQGNPPGKFFKEIDTRSGAIGAEFVLIDMPTAEGRAETQKDAREMGLVPYFVKIPAVDLIDWGYDKDGSLAFAVSRGTRIEHEDGPFSDHITVKTITLWEKTGWTRYVSRNDEDYALDGEGVLSIGVVPIVPVLYEQETPMTGRSVIDDVASLILRVFNQDSELDKMLFDAALPILAGYGIKPKEMDEVYKATSSIWTFTDSEAELRYVEPSGTSFGAKRQQIQDDVEAIREISLRQTKPKGAQVESAEAKRLDTIQLSSQLADFARNAAAAERRCWEIAAKYVGADQSAIDAITIKYNETFDPEALREKLTQTFLELRDNGDISRETVWKSLGWDEKRIAEEKLLLENEQRSRSGPEGSMAGAISALMQRQEQGS